MLSIPLRVFAAGGRPPRCSTGNNHFQFPCGYLQPLPQTAIYPGPGLLSIPLRVFAAARAEEALQDLLLLSIPLRVFGQFEHDFDPDLPSWSFNSLAGICVTLIGLINAHRSGTSFNSLAGI